MVKIADSSMFAPLYDYTQAINNSKLFAGLMIIVLNVASRFVTIKLSKTMESYLRNTVSMNALIFVIAWMGSRDVITATVITVIFIICFDYLFNENSRFCVFPESFTDYHKSLYNSAESTAPATTTPSLPGTN